MTQPTARALKESQLRAIERQKIRDDLVLFVKAVAPEIVPAKFHLLIAEKLMAVARGDIKRLALFLPPGHGKSSWASHWFPAWYVGRNPRNAVLGTSHGAEFAEQWSRWVRDMIDTDEYKKVFDTRLSPNTQASHHWETTQRGVYNAAGVGKKIHGRRADLVIIDDPIGSAEDADSKLERDRAWRWYNYDVNSRMNPGCAVVLIQTRHHEDDLAGRLLERMEQGGEQWDVLCLPAEAEENDPLGREVGEWLWPEYFPSTEYVQRKLNQETPRDWSALYQQRPSPVGGLYFEEDWLQWYDKKPDRLTKYGASDYAITAGGGDYTVHGIFGVDEDDNIYVLDWWRKQTASDQWVEVLLDLMVKHKPMTWAEEKDQITKSIGPFLVKRMRERRVYCNRRQFSSKGDKAIKAQSIRARMSQGKVYFPKSAPWMPDLMAEILRFPAGKHDDQVDVLGLLGRMMDRMVPARAPPPTPIDPFEVKPLTFDELIAAQPKRDDSARRARI